jgi:hypothetical protein
VVVWEVMKVLDRPLLMLLSKNGEMNWALLWIRGLISKPSIFSEYLSIVNLWDRIPMEIFLFKELSVRVLHREILGFRTLSIVRIFPK